MQDKKSLTSFKVLNLAKSDQSNQSAGSLEQPVLVSFPYNTPAKEQLAQMKFNLYEEQRPGQEKSRAKKRVLKSAYKALKYEAASTQADIKGKSQGSDYYLGVYDSVKNKCYALPIDTAY